MDPNIGRMDDESMLADSDFNAVKLVKQILDTDNQVLTSKVQSFEQEFVKTWEHVVVDAHGGIAKLPPLFNSLKHRINRTKQQKAQLDAILTAVTNSQSHTTSTTNELKTKLENDSNGLTSNLLANKHGVIRSVCLVVDLSDSSLEKDIRPTRFDFISNLACQFIEMFIDQHPLSEITSLSTAQGHCKIRTGMRQPKQDYIDNLKRSQDASESKGGVFSIQNTIHSCGHLLQSAAPQACKEIIILTCSLNTVDVRDIEETIQYCIKDDITINIIGLDACVRIFERICSMTGGRYQVACDTTQFTNFLHSHLQAPIKQQKHTKRGWIQVAFPSVKTATTQQQQIQQRNNSTQIKSQYMLMCLCHNKLRERVYVCPTCSASVCQIPNQCPICKTLLLSYPLLARSASQLHIPSPTIPVHFNDSLLPLKDTEGITTDDNIQQIMRTRRPALRFKRNNTTSTTKQNDFMNKNDDGISYVDDGPSITKANDDSLVQLETFTFDKSLTTVDVIKMVQDYQLKNNIIHTNQNPLQSTTTTTNSTTTTTSTTMGDPIDPIPSTTNSTNSTSTTTNNNTNEITQIEHYGVKSTTCQTHIVHCQGCTSPLIVPTTKLLETALVYSGDVTNIQICTCAVCKNTDLVTSCSVCGCFLCPDCDHLTQTMLQNCPGCFS